MTPLLLVPGSTGFGASEEETVRAVAAIRPTEGNETWGIVEFTQVEGGVRVVATIHRLEADQQHGFHVHEWGDCRDARAERAGEHFNPTDSPHGAPHDRQRHVGDLGNIQADSFGVGRYHRIDTHLQLSGEKSIVGRAIVIHQGEDDLTTQPAGDAGPRIGCGVIGWADPTD